MPFVGKTVENRREKHYVFGYELNSKRLNLYPIRFVRIIQYNLIRYPICIVID